MPSAIVAIRSSGTGRPAASEGGYAAAPAACTPTTRTSGRCAFTATAMPGQQPAAAGADHDRAHLRALLQDLQADRALPGDDVRVVERVDEHRAGLARRTPAPRPAPRRRCAPCEPHLARRRPRVAATFGSGAPSGMNTVDSHAQQRRRQRDALRVVAGAGRDDAVRALVRRRAGRSGRRRRGS